MQPAATSSLEKDLCLTLTFPSPGPPVKLVVVMGIDGIREIGQRDTGAEIPRELCQKTGLSADQPRGCDAWIVADWVS